MSAVSYISLGIITVNVNGAWMLNWNVIMYYILCILLVVNAYRFLSGRGQMIAASITVPLFFLVFYFFYLRWFGTPAAAKAAAAAAANSCDSSKTTTVANAQTWPPIVNMCPDFMVGWTDTKNNNKVYCYDANNTYSLKSYNGAGLTTGLTINGEPAQSAYLVFDPTQNPTAKKPSADQGGKRWPLYALINSNLATIANDAHGMYLKWEGVIEGPGQTYNAWQTNIVRSMPGL